MFEPSTATGYYVWNARPSQYILLPLYLIDCKESHVTSQKISWWLGLLKLMLKEETFLESINSFRLTPVEEFPGPARQLIGALLQTAYRVAQNTLWFQLVPMHRATQKLCTWENERNFFLAHLANTEEAWNQDRVRLNLHIWDWVEMNIVQNNSLFFRKCIFCYIFSYYIL